jgi:hypothetical protein
MANELMTHPEIHENENLTTADLVKQSQRPDGAAPPAEHREALLPGEESERFRSRWHDIQGSFVDEPRQAVEKADELVANAIKRLAEVFADERSKLETAWGKGNDVSTEDLRQALRRYRSFFDRLLSV